MSPTARKAARVSAGAAVTGVAEAAGVPGPGADPFGPALVQLTIDTTIRTRRGL
jgi:hypothetical protein